MENTKGCVSDLACAKRFEGGDFEVLGQEFNLYAEGRQGLYNNLETNQTEPLVQIYGRSKKRFQRQPFWKKEASSA